MLKKSNLGRALGAALNSRSLTQQEFAARAGIEQATLNRILNHGNRPAPDTLRAICAALPNRAGADLLIEHLHDEVSRAGHNPAAVEIAPADRREDEALAAAALNLRRIGVADPALYERILDLIDHAHRVAADGAADKNNRTKRKRHQGAAPISD